MRDGEDTGARPGSSCGACGEPRSDVSIARGDVLDSRDAPGAPSAVTPVTIPVSRYTSPEFAGSR